jgi:hypothetical protein
LPPHDHTPGRPPNPVRLPGGVDGQFDVDLVPAYPVEKIPRTGPYPPAFRDVEADLVNPDRAGEDRLRGNGGRASEEVPSPEENGVPVDGPVLIRGDEGGVVGHLEGVFPYKSPSGSRTSGSTSPGDSGN